MKNSSPESKGRQKKRPDTKVIREQREWLSSSLRFLARVKDFREHPPDIMPLLNSYGIRLPNKRGKLPTGLPLPAGGIPFVTLLNIAPEVAQVISGQIDAELLEDEIRETYESAQQRFLQALSCRDNNDAMEILARFGPRLLAKDPLDPGPALGTLDSEWRYFWALSEEHRQELHSYGITDESIAGNQKRERERRRSFFEAIGKALGRKDDGRPPLPETEQPLSKRDAVARSAAVKRLLQRYRAYLKKRSPEKAFQLVEEELARNSRILPERKPLILLSFRRKAAERNPVLDRAKPK